MNKVLGLDLGTNSIGWAIVEQNDDSTYTLIDKGVNIFKEGVNIEKGIESPAVQQRTDARASRRHYFRRRLRKIELLKVLVREQLCPYISDEDLDDWKSRRLYPLDPDFMCWQRTDQNTDKNPYHDRNRALTESLDMTKRADRYCLGRALYHLNQRRGFLSNRKEASSGEDGVVKKGISDLSERMLEAGCQYIGEYFYELYKRGEKIRTTYTSRNEHVKAEFDAICIKQNLSADLIKALESAIFFQRPLKSQKGLVGKCTFEKNKPRCQVSHPRFEEFRMLSFINSIRVKSFSDEDYRPLNEKEVEAILPLFYRRSSPHFDFEDIAKKLAGKKNYSFKDDKVQLPHSFNFRLSTTVSGCPVTSSIIAAIGSSPNDWEDDLCSQYLKGEGKSKDEIINDVWHALVTFDNDDMLVNWLVSNLQIGHDDAKKLAKDKIPQGYASLSLKAISNILPYLRNGYRYDEAVFMGNLSKVLHRAGVLSDRNLFKAEKAIMEVLDDYAGNPLRKTTKEQTIKERLAELFGIDIRFTDCLYHPSMIEVYQTAQPDETGKIRLGSPRTESLRNPMAMRALFRLRILVNRLLDEGKIDRNTKVNIEFARGLNDANMRAAIYQYQRELEKEYKGYEKEIADAIKAETGNDIIPTETDILKYKLWKEQQGRCLYTGQSIAVSDFIGDGNRFDIEHTVPRSRGGDDSQVNKTLCENRFNRDVKKSSIPFELANYDEVMARVEALGWKEKIETLKKGIDGQKRRSKAAETKDAKDRAIRQMHYLRIQLDYWQGKLFRFTMTSVPEGVSNRQGVDIGIIGKYGREYLKTVFPKVYTVKGSTTAEFRKMWGLQPEYAKKERVNHTHHCIDAITIACIGKKEYDNWAQYKREQDRYLWERKEKPSFPKPWSTFTQDVKQVADELLVYHYRPDNLQKQSRKILKVNGKIQYGQDGKPLYVQGDTARASLHKDTYYGAICKDDEVKYVIRKPLDNNFSEKDVKAIVDDAVRQKVYDSIEKYGNLKKAIENGIWMNEEKSIPIKKVRVYTSMVTSVSAVDLKKQRDKSRFEYKRDYHVANDGNYCMAIYGEEKPGFMMVSNLEAARVFNAKPEEKRLVPKVDSKGRLLSMVLKIGTLVLLYENNKNELYSMGNAELCKRMYEITGLKTSTDTREGKHYQSGRITLKHHQEAQPNSALKEKMGPWKDGEEYRPMILMSHSQIRCLVQGVDFNISEDGTVSFL